MKTVFRLVLSTSLVVCGAITCTIVSPQFPVVAENWEMYSDEQAVQQLVLQAEPVGSLRQIDSTKIVENYALVGISDDYTGGVVLLKKDNETWAIVFETGGALGKSDLIRKGVPEYIAEGLSSY